MSCLFNSFSYFLKQDSTNIRNRICDYLQENKPIIDGLDTKIILDMDRPNYIQHMRKTSTWGGAIEIQAACNIWHLSIIVHNIRDNNRNKIEFLPIDKSNCKKIEITWSGGHYEPLKT